MKKIVFAISLFTFFLYPVYANEASTKPLSRMLRGEVHYSWLIFDVYHAKLWAPKGEDIFSKPFTLELKYKRDFLGSDITDRSVTELKGQGVNKDLLSKWDGKLRSIFPDIKKGDTIFANFNPSNGVTFILNGNKNIGVIKEQGFSIAFMNIWLGPKTSEKDMRNKLLGILQ
jgi:hypothetical protein